jgi:hypothetical protein
MLPCISHPIIKIANVGQRANLKYTEYFINENARVCYGFCISVLTAKESIPHIKAL